MLWKQSDVIFNKMYVCMYMIALGIITKLDPPLNSHHKLQTIASHNGCDYMENVPLVGLKKYFFSTDGHSKIPMSSANKRFET